MFFGNAIRGVANKHTKVLPTLSDCLIREGSRETCLFPWTWWRYWSDYSIPVRNRAGSPLKSLLCTSEGIGEVTAILFRSALVYESLALPEWHWQSQNPTDPSIDDLTSVWKRSRISINSANKVRTVHEYFHILFCSSVGKVSSQHKGIPKIPFMESDILWLLFARNSDLALVEAIASSRLCQFDCLFP